MINCSRGNTQQARIQRFGWEHCCMFAHCILLDNPLLWGYAYTDCCLCYKVTMKLIFRCVETAQALQESGQFLGVCPWGKSCCSWRQENESMRYFLCLLYTGQLSFLCLEPQGLFLVQSASFDGYQFQCHGKEQIGYPEWAQWVLHAPLAGSTQTFQGTWQQRLSNGHNNP